MIWPRRSGSRPGLTTAREADRAGGAIPDMENVTSGASSRAIAGPMPFTR